jgi:hypothetical protein
VIEGVKLKDVEAVGVLEVAGLDTGSAAFGNWNPPKDD